MALAKLVKFSVGLILLGLIVAFGWFVYPFVTGHQYVGTVDQINLHLAGYVGFNVITLQGSPHTYILAPSGINKGDYVMVSGHSESNPLIGTIVFGTEKLSSLNVAASVTPYMPFPLTIVISLVGVGLAGMALGILSFLVKGSLFYAGMIVTYFRKTRNNPLLFGGGLLSLGGCVLFITSFLGSIQSLQFLSILEFPAKIMLYVGTPLMLLGLYRMRRKTVLNNKKGNNSEVVLSENKIEPRFKIGTRIRLTNATLEKNYLAISQVVLKKQCANLFAVEALQSYDEANQCYLISLQNWNNFYGRNSFPENYFEKY
jgi:hypothetical protein